MSVHLYSAVPGHDGCVALLSPGRDTDTAVVFVHGNPGFSQDWENLLERVGAFSRGVAPDMPGFGDSGKPKSFDREMYWMAFVSVGALAGFIIVYTQRSGGTWPHPVQLACLGLGALLFGVALGFGVGIFTRRRSSLPD